MIIHTYLTDGFFDWGILFLKSLKRHNGERYEVVMDVRDLSIDQIHSLSMQYKNLDIKSGFFDYDKIGREFGLTGDQLKKVKSQVEARKTKVTVSDYQIWWKQFISVDSRYNESIHDILKERTDSILHIDIDTYFRSNLSVFQDLVDSNDVSLVFRLHVNKPERKIFGTMIGISGERGRYFHSVWKNIIEQNPIKKRKHNFGQLSLFDTYKKLKNDIKWGNIDYKKISRKQNDKNALLWTGNANGKIESLKNCYKDFEKWRKN